MLVCGAVTVVLAILGANALNIIATVSRVTGPPRIDATDDNGGASGTHRPHG
jgi:hypothetical protein